MQLSFVYWFLLLVWILFSGWAGYGPNGDRRWYGFGLIVFLLFVLIGLHDFGSPLKGG